VPAVLFVCLPVSRIRASASTERCLPVPNHDAKPVLQALGVGTRPKDPEAVRDHGLDHQLLIAPFMNFEFCLNPLSLIK